LAEMKVKPMRKVTVMVAITINNTSLPYVNTHSYFKICYFR
jgi:hypothetical protein